MSIFELSIFESVPQKAAMLTRKSREYTGIIKDTFKSCSICVVMMFILLYPILSLLPAQGLQMEISF